VNRTTVVLVAVLAVGYSMYGGLFLAAGAANGALVDEPSVDRSAGDGDGAAFGAEDDAEPFRFAAVDGGLDYSYVSESSGMMQVMTNAGLYAGDYDTDGWPDLLAIGGERPVLFENRDGSFVRSGALPDLERSYRSATFVDYDVDGDPDLVLLADGARPLVLENVGDRFERRGRFGPRLSTPFGAAAHDYDRDGCPDLFVYQYGDWTEDEPVARSNYSVSLDRDNGHANVLYRGDCSGFEPAPGRTGIDGRGWSLAGSFVDLNDDGRPDVHVANDFNHDVVYLNRGDGRFERVILPERTNRNGMSSEVADVTGDGKLDVFVTNIYYPEWAAARINPATKLKARGNNLVANLGNGTFVMRGEQYDVTVGGWGWAAVIADFDNDGAEDLFHTTRHMTFDNRDMLFSDEQIDRLRRNDFYSYPAVWERADLTSFRRVDAERSGFESANGRGVARLDYDRDGDADLAVAAPDGYRLYENRMDRGNAIQVRVLGRNGSTTAAYGASVTVAAGDRTQTRRVHARTDFFSQDSRLVHVGVGNRTRVDVRVRWPDGTERVVEAVRVGQRLVVGPDGSETTGLSGG